MTGGKADYNQRGLIPRSIHKVPCSLAIGQLPIDVPVSSRNFTLQTCWQAYLTACSCPHAFHKEHIPMLPERGCTTAEQPLKQSLLSPGFCRLEEALAVNMHRACQLLGDLQRAML